VVALARNADALSTLTDETKDVVPVPVDVTDVDSVQSAVARVIKEFGEINVLVNGAGFGLFGALEEIPIAGRPMWVRDQRFGPSTP
jgi:NADP-dependent 3-hydroxy acid dehydrogenase YdfG